MSVWLLAVSRTPRRRAGLQDSMGAVTSTLERLVIDVTWSCHEWLYGSARSASGACSLPRPDAAPRWRRHNQRHHYNVAASSSSSSSSCGGSLRRHALQDRKVALPQAPAAPVRPAPPPPPPPQPAFPAGASTLSSTTSSSSDDDWPAALPPPRRRFPRDAGKVLQLAPTATSTPDGLAVSAATTTSYQRRRATMSFMSPANGPRRHYHPHHHHHHHHRSEDEEEVGAVRPRASKRPNVPYSTLQAMLFRCTAARNGCLSSKDYKDKAYPVSRLGRSWSMHNAGANRAATL